MIGIYDFWIYLVRVFVNGDLEGKEYGSGLLFFDWGVRVGFGFNLFGYFDEIYIYRCVLLEGEIDWYLDSLSGNFFFYVVLNFVDIESFIEIFFISSFLDLNIDLVWFL